MTHRGSICPSLHYVLC